MTTTAPPTRWHTLDIADADIRWCSDMFTPAHADALFTRLRQQTVWTQQTVIARGKPVHLPRLSAWHGHADYHFIGANTTMTANPWTPDLRLIKNTIEHATGARFNGVLLTLYRDGHDGVTWHSDDEPALGPMPTIASVSLGATRTFELRRKASQTIEYAVSLTHGSCLVMAGGTQQQWHHRIPPDPATTEPRINLTFRLLQTQS